MEETRKAQGHQNCSQTHAGETEETRAGNQRHAGARGAAGGERPGPGGCGRRAEPGRSRSGSTRRGRASAEPVTPGRPRRRLCPGEEGPGREREGLAVGDAGGMFSGHLREYWKINIRVDRKCRLHS